jgi:hypothetical protein
MSDELLAWLDWKEGISFFLNVPSFYLEEDSIESTDI